MVSGTGAKPKGAGGGGGGEIRTTLLGTLGQMVEIQEVGPTTTSVSQDEQ